MYMQGKVTSATVQGNRRFQEDCYVLKQLELINGKLVQVMAVFDGHNGAETALQCAELTEKYFELATLNSAKVQMADFFSLLNTRTKNNESGCTASIACIFESDDIVIVATLGDSPVLVHTSSNNISAIVLHNISTNPKERAAVIARGADCVDAYMSPPKSRRGLQLTRALGDVHFEKYLSREPEIVRFSIGESSFVMVASDGILFGHSLEASVPILKKISTKIREDGSAEEVLDCFKTTLDAFGDNTTLLAWNRTEYLV